MKSTCLILVLLNEIFLGNGTEKEHIHFKIHVPEIIKHHIHTKTIFIHKLVPHKKYVPKKKEIPKKKKPSYHHEEDHNDDHHEWKYWSNSYFHHDDNGQSHHDFVNHEVKQEEGSKEGYQDQIDFNNYVHPDSYFPQRESQEENLSSKDQTNGLIGYSYPPQYSQHPEVHEISDNRQEKPTYNYEEGYRKGSQLESGAIYTKELNKYNFGTEEEEREEKSKEKEEEEEKDNKDIIKTQAGRYFVTEEDIEHDHSHEGSEIKKVL